MLNRKFHHIQQIVWSCSEFCFINLRRHGPQKFANNYKWALSYKMYPGVRVNAFSLAATVKAWLKKVNIFSNQ